MNPRRETTVHGDGSATIKVTAPGGETNEVILTRDQYLNYLKWRTGAVLIQDALPGLTKEQREILMSGLGQKTWDKTFKPRDPED